MSDDTPRTDPADAADAADTHEHEVVEEPAVESDPADPAPRLIDATRAPITTHTPRRARVLAIVAIVACLIGIAMAVVQYRQIDSLNSDLDTARTTATEQVSQIAELELRPATYEDAMAKVKAANASVDAEYANKVEVYNTGYAAFAEAGYDEIAPTLPPLPVVEPYIHPEFTRRTLGELVADADGKLQRAEYGTETVPATEVYLSWSNVVTRILGTANFGGVGYGSGRFEGLPVMICSGDPDYCDDNNSDVAATDIAAQLRVIAESETHLFQVAGMLDAMPKPVLATLGASPDKVKREIGEHWAVINTVYPKFAELEQQLLVWEADNAQPHPFAGGANGGKLGQWHLRRWINTGRSDHFRLVYASYLAMAAEKYGMDEAAGMTTWVVARMESEAVPAHVRSHYAGWYLPKLIEQRDALAAANSGGGGG